MRQRWFQLALGILAMIMVANLQYGWTLFVKPMSHAHHWSKASVQLAFTIFVLCETFIVPVEGWFVDRFGPRLMIVGGGVLVGISWVMNSAASSLSVLYAAAAIGGIGAGMVYGTAVGNAMKWFPDRRGLAAGLTAAGFGAGSALTIVPIANMIKASGYAHTFFTFGLIQGICVVAAGLLLVRPPASALKTAPKITGAVWNATPGQVLATPAFWLIYAMFVMIATGGLLITAQASVIASDYKVADVPVSLAGITLAALPFALTLDRIMNGLSRPAFGALSDRIGREAAMCIAFTVQAVALLSLLAFASSPVAFVLLTGLMFFTAGEIYSLFPALMTDLFGAEYATTNYGLLYTGKGVASFVVPIGSVVSAATGSWHLMFYTITAFNVIVGLLAIFAIRPLRESLLARRGRRAPVIGETITAGGVAPAGAVAQ